MNINERIYNNEEEANEAALITMIEILSNKNYLEDDKFDKLYSQYREMQQEIDKTIQSKISQQIEAINQSKSLMENCFNNIEKCQQQIIILNEEYEKDQSFHKELLSYEQLFTYRKNVGLMLDQMKYLFSVQEQIDKMNSTFEGGTENYDSLFYKLIALVDIRDNIMEAANTSRQDLQVIINEFKCLSDFETKFYAKVFGQLEFTLELSIKQPQQLIKILQIVETGDKVMGQKNKMFFFKERAIKMIVKGIDDKFNTQLADAQDSLQILEKSKFTSQDLILVYDHTVRCFPKHYNIFQIYQEQYRINVEKRIMPFLEDEEQITKSFGTLISLLSWVDSYQELLKRVGEQSESYVALTCKVKSYMPIFQDHVNNLIIDYSEKAIEKDFIEQQTQSNIEKLIKSKQDLMTYFPEDIFHFINQQFDLLGPKLKGEILIEFIRSVCSTLSEVLKKECRKFINELPLTEQDNQISPLYLAILQTNNYYKCMTHSNETKQYCLQFVEQSNRDRVEQIIYQDLTINFNDSINELLELCVKIVFQEVNNVIVPQLFTPKWVNDDLINQGLLTIKDYLQEVQLLIFNQIHFNKLVKLIFKRLITIYFEQLIFTVQYIQPNIAKEFFPKYLTNLSFIGEDKDKKKKEKDKKSGITMILSNRELVVPQIIHDRDQILKVGENDYLSQLGKSTLQGMEKNLTCLVSALSKPKNELDGMISQIVSNFEGNSVYLMEIVLYMREDCDAKYKSGKIEQVQQAMKKI